ncbi:hypothetical protein [Saccharothrix deserti]|uniref:hypothetical protein n=1 Tax=Saccharothrix deserti TaxID=2593674 RepID=UPI00131A6AED|nr:hypothetical protein [Saccharothrix deserti]
MSGSLLVNFVYCHPVGHAIEAVHRCHGYRLANPDLRIGVVLNSATPCELAEISPFIDEVYPVDVDVFDGTVDFRPQLGAIAPDWDQIVEDERASQAWQRSSFPGLARYYDDARAYLRPGTATFPYQRGGHLRLPIAATRPAASPAPVSPAAATRAPASPTQVPAGPAADTATAASPARATVTAADSSAADSTAIGPSSGHTTSASASEPVRIAVLPGGSSPRELYPSVRSWRLVLDALAERFPGVEFLFVGKLNDDGRTSTSFGRDEFAGLVASVERSVSVVDRPLLDQLGAVAGSDVLVSPHTGFGMAALAVGAPWLTISGNKWPEYYFPGTPFYSVLPDVSRFPCYTLFGPDPEPVDDDGPRSPSMSFERISADLGEIVEGAARLVERRWDFETAMVDHYRRMWALPVGASRWLWSVDDVHRAYLP